MRLAVPFAAAVLAFAAGAALAAGPLPPPTVKAAGRTTVVSLPYRTADGLIWVSATRVSEASPFTFKGLDIKPNGGPSGTDLAVFTYTADRSGSATLKFGLVPPGKMLIGPPTLVYKGPVAATFQTKATAP